MTASPLPSLSLSLSTSTSSTAPAEPAQPADPDPIAAAGGFRGDERRRFLQQLCGRKDTARRLGPSCKDDEKHLKALADRLTRHGFVSAVPGRPERLLLSDRQRVPRAAFRSDKSSLPDATEREWLAGELDKQLTTRHGLSLGFGRPVPHELPGHGPGTLVLPPRPLPRDLRQEETPARALQVTALASLFTNNWKAGWWEMPSDKLGRRWHLDADTAFPSAASLRRDLTAMRQGYACPPLFERPKGARDALDAPIDAGLRAKVAEIDTVRLETDLLQALAGRPAGDRLRGGARQSIQAVKAVQTLFASDPTLTLRRLMQSYPDSLDWLYPAPAVSTPVSRTRIDGPELSDLLRQASPFNPFKPRDKVLAPLLRDAIALRAMKPDRRRLAAARLRASLTAALIRIGDPAAVGGGPQAAQRALKPGDERRREVLRRLISDTDDRYAPQIAALQPPEKTRRPWSWFR